MFHYLSRSLKSRKNIADSLPDLREAILNTIDVPDDGEYYHLHSPQMYEYMGLGLPNRIGLGAGFDVNADYIDLIGHLGFGFIEFGTVSPDPYTNEDTVQHRNTSFHRYPIHYPSLGIDYLVNNLKKSRYIAAGGIVGVNIGHNHDTPKELAVNDYEECLFKAYDYVSYITINVDRDDHYTEAYWDKLLQHMKKAQLRIASKKKKYVPLLIKMNADFSEKESIDLCHICTGLYIDGIIATGGSIDTEKKPKMNICGEEIQEKSERYLRSVVSKTSPSTLCIIASGGIHTPNDVSLRFQMGADLVQVMSGFLEKKQLFLSACLAEMYSYS